MSFESVSPGDLLACKYCIMTKGLKGSELKDLPKTTEEFILHIERDHNIPVKRAGESELTTLFRFYRDYPEAQDPKTCKCPECEIKRNAKA